MSFGTNYTIILFGFFRLHFGFCLRGQIDAQFVELFLKKAIPALYKSLGIFLPLITTNCAVLGVAIINVQEGYGFVDMLVFSVASAVGFGLALVLFAGIRERFEISRIPKELQGTGIGLVTAGIIALSFVAFQGMI